MITLTLVAVALKMPKKIGNLRGQKQIRNHNERLNAENVLHEDILRVSECDTCDGSGYWMIPSPNCATCDTYLQWDDGAECDDCDAWYCDNHLTEDGGCKVCGNTVIIIPWCRRHSQSGMMVS